MIYCVALYGPFVFCACVCVCACWLKRELFVAYGVALYGLCFNVVRVCLDWPNHVLVCFVCGLLCGVWHVMCCCVFVRVRLCVVVMRLCVLVCD